MNSRRQDCSPGCLFCRLRIRCNRSLRRWDEAAELQQAGGGTGYAFGCKPAEDQVAHRRHGQRTVSFLRLYDSAAGVVSMGGS